MQQRAIDFTYHEHNRFRAVRAPRLMDGARADWVRRGDVLEWTFGDCFVMIYAGGKEQRIIPSFDVLKEIGGMEVRGDIRRARKR